MTCHIIAAELMISAGGCQDPIAWGWLKGFCVPQWQQSQKLHEHSWEVWSNFLFSADMTPSTIHLPILNLERLVKMSWLSCSPIQTGPLMNCNMNYIKCILAIRLTLVYDKTTCLLLTIHIRTDARSCVTCDRVLAELEKIDDDTDSFGVDFVKINDKRLAKQYGINKFPALTYFRYFLYLWILANELFVLNIRFLQGKGADHLRWRFDGRGRCAGLPHIAGGHGSARSHWGSERENSGQNHRRHRLRGRLVL